MIRALLLSAIIGVAAYHYGVEAGKKEARTELSQAIPASQVHHHNRHRKTAGLEDTERPDGRPQRADAGMDGAVTDEAQLLEHKATAAVTDTLKAQAASTVHNAVAYIEKKLKGSPSDSAWDDQAGGH